MGNPNTAAIVENGAYLRIVTLRFDVGGTILEVTFKEGDGKACYLKG